MGIKNTFSAENLERISDLLIKYLEVKSELIKLQIKEQIAQVLSVLVFTFILLLFGFLIIIILSFALALYLNEVLESSYMGFAILFGFYLLIFIVMIFNRKKILRNLVVKVISEDHFESEN